MITLKTGAIGSGKTLSAVSEIAKLQDRWKKHENEWREVYAFGVRDLALPHKPLQSYPVGGKPGDPIEFDDLGQPKTDVIPQWETVAPGSIVIVDECHRLFPSSGPGRPPAHIAWLDMSRQAGIDLILITQHPRKIHVYARTSVNKHQHYRRAFGGARSIVYEWDECAQTLNYKSATTGLFNYPKDSFKFYKSAEEHTKIKFAVPGWLAIPVAGIVLGIFAIPSAYSALKGAATGEGIGSSAKLTEAGKGEPESVSAANPPASGSVPDQPASNPGLPQLAGCIEGPNGGFCLDVNGKRVDVPPDVLKFNARNLGGFVRYAMTPTQPATLRPGDHVKQDDAPALAGFGESSTSPRRDVVRPLTGGLYSSGGAPAHASDRDGAVLADIKAGRL